MTLTKRCKALGLPSAKPLMEATEFSRQRLEYMMRENYPLFELACLGLAAKLSSKSRG